MERKFFEEQFGAISQRLDGMEHRMGGIEQRISEWMLRTRE